MCHAKTGQLLFVIRQHFSNKHNDDLIYGGDCFGQFTSLLPDKRT